MISFNTQWVKDEDKLLKLIFNAFDLERNGELNLYDYVALRSFNNAYDILLAKEGAVYYKNFGVAIHIICRNM
jgi:hypothetical protein